MHADLLHAAAPAAAVPCSEDVRTCKLRTNVCLFAAASACIMCLPICTMTLLLYLWSRCRLARRGIFAAAVAGLLLGSMSDHSSSVNAKAPHVAQQLVTCFTCSSPLSACLRLASRAYSPGGEEEAGGADANSAETKRDPRPTQTHPVRPMLSIVCPAAEGQPHGHASAQCLPQCYTRSSSPTVLGPGDGHQHQRPLAAQARRLRTMPSPRDPTR